MTAHVRLARFAGIDIGFHYSWLIIAMFFTVSFAASFDVMLPDRPWYVVWTAAIMTGVLFFASILIHEMGHVLVARAYGLRVRSITLFALGGMASIEKESGHPTAELWMGITGLMSNVMLGFGFAGLADVFPWDDVPVNISPWAMSFLWLSTVNFVLAAVNLLPGFPLDGGRVLRALLWQRSGRLDRATRSASRVGQGVGVAFIVWGFFELIENPDLGSVWLVLIGWFLLEAATFSHAGIDIAAGLRDLRVRDIMSEDCLRVEGGTSLQDFANQYVLRTGARCFVVQNDETPIGVITPSDLAKIDRIEWPRMTVNHVVRPFSPVRAVSPDTSVVEALQLMGREDVNQVPVMMNGRMKGMLSRGRVVQLLEARAQLSM